MPVSLNNGEVYIVDDKVNIERKWALSFFLNGHVEDYLLLQDGCGRYSGIITYKSLLKNSNLDIAVIHEKLYLQNDFWENARTLLESGKTIDAVPVFDQNMEILYFAKHDAEIVRAWEKLCDLETHVDKSIWNTLRCHTNRIHIRGINDVLFRLRQWLLLLGVKVSVEGEEWSLWGIENTECVEKDAVVVDQGCKWIDSVYIEYLDYLKYYGAGLRAMLCKPYISEADKKEKVMFYLSNYPYYVESIEPLILRYVRQDVECVCVFPSTGGIEKQGRKNIERMTMMVEKLEAAGAKCHVADDKELFYHEYDIVFFLSDDLGRLPLALRRISWRLVALQETPVYPHMYMQKDLFNEVFSEKARQEIDYLVVSDYMADWICGHDKKWEEKVLRFGYPKLDLLYHALKNKPDIPKQWSDRILNKKVYLFTTYGMQQTWLEFFANKEDSKIAIWRPHPLTLENTQVKERIEEIVEKYNVIIDDMPSYYTSFQISDAMIATASGSIAINYLYTGKPIYLCDDESYESKGIDYREELWYKSAYSISGGGGLGFYEKG